MMLRLSLQRVSLPTSWGVLDGVASEALDLTGFYYSGKPPAVKKKSNSVGHSPQGVPRKAGKYLHVSAIGDDLVPEGLYYLDSLHGDLKEELKEEMKVELHEEMKNELKEEMREEI
uniref:Phosphoinositide phosphatase SAC1 n=1 Tax=Tanacetum cinerariifolium TaxID=118510 RepID=A0A6L2JFB0_TANCI|nr:phosphoinositide phosphatase SAC1 [Tanacetum cinerariifolium]